MQLTSKNPREQGRIDGRIAEINRHGFEIIESSDFPGHAFRTKCRICGHQLKINQHIRRFRHAQKHETP